MQQYQQTHILFSKELIFAYIELFQTFIDNCRQQLSLPLRQFLGSRDFEPHIMANLSAQDVSRLVAVIIYYHLTPNIMNLNFKRQINYISYIKEFQKLQLDPSTTLCLLKVLQETST